MGKIALDVSLIARRATPFTCRWRADPCEDRRNCSNPAIGMCTLAQGRNPTPYPLHHSSVWAPASCFLSRSLIALRVLSTSQRQKRRFRSFQPITMYDDSVEELPAAIPTDRHGC